MTSNTNMTFQLRNLITKHLNERLKEIDNEIIKLEMERDHLNQEKAHLKAKSLVDKYFKF